MKEYLRINTNCGFYADIAREHNISAQSAYSELTKIKDKIINEDTYIEYGEEADRKEREFSKNCIIAVTFSAMALEAFIYDYAAIEFGDEYVKNYIDKLDTVAKWVIVPRIVAGKEISKDKHCFELLRQTVRLRNEFVHSKSRQFNEEVFYNLSNKFGTKQLSKYSADAIKAMDELANEIDFIDREINAKFHLHCSKAKR